MDMAAARDVDIQREAIRALATASVLTTNQIRVVAFDVASARAATTTTTATTATSTSGSKLVDLLSTLLGSSDVEVSRCAAMLVANVSSQASLLPQLLSLLGALLLLLESSSTSSDTSTTSVQLAGREARRQAARALAAICHIYAATIRRDKNASVIIAAIDRHRNGATDEQYKLLLTAALSSLLPSSFTPTP